MGRVEDGATPNLAEPAVSSALVRSAMQSSRDAETAEALWRQSAAVPVPIMVRYLCEYLATDIETDYPSLRMVPGAHLFVTHDTPAAVRDAIDSVASPARARRNVAWNSADL
jgi:hypothetical protein